MPLSAVLVLVFAFARVLSKVNSVQSKVQAMLVESSALWSIVSMIDAARSEQERHGGAAPPPLDRGLRFRDVSVHYEGRPVLEEASFELIEFRQLPREDDRPAVIVVKARAPDRERKEATIEKV